MRAHKIADSGSGHDNALFFEKYRDLFVTDMSGAKHDNGVMDRMEFAEAGWDRREAAGGRKNPAGGVFVHTDLHGKILWNNQVKSDDSKFRIGLIEPVFVMQVPERIPIRSRRCFLANARGGVSVR
ncbi:hypothetical protein Ga0100230_007680 [Opitutaceae bacterium TAV3]|nr:hypothetical protein Ga0100230_007680 [Opitutaceae bacterium TAV3]